MDRIKTPDIRDWGRIWNADHQNTDLWKVMIISQKHWQWTFSVSKSEGDMSPLVIMIARLLPKPTIWRKQETLCCIRKISLLRCRRGAAWVICISFLAFLLLIWYEWERSEFFWNGIVKFSQTAGPGEMLVILSMNLLGRKTSFEIIFCVTQQDLHVLDGTLVWVCPTPCPDQIPTGSPFTLLSALFGFCILKEKMDQ